MTELFDDREYAAEETCHHCRCIAWFPRHTPEGAICHTCDHEYASQDTALTLERAYKDELRDDGVPEHELHEEWLAFEKEYNASAFYRLLWKAMDFLGLRRG